MSTIHVQSPIKLKSMPDLAGIFQQMKIRDQLELISPDHSLLGYSIGLALRNKTPLGEILELIYSQYVDNREAVLNIVGEDAMNRILKLLKK